MNRALCLAVVLLLIVSVFISTNVSIAENTFDVHDYTDDELIDIVRAIHDADTNLGYIYYGDVLKVGEDIPAGHYEFWVEESDVGGSSDDLLARICWDKNYRGEYLFESYQPIYERDYGVHIQITLEDGYYVWTQKLSDAKYFSGVRMKYIPNRRSGFFSN